MRRHFEMRGPLALLAVSLAGGWSSTAVFAACGMAAVSGGASGPPSISTTETSTTQVLEQIRRRTQEAQNPQPIPILNTSGAAASSAAADAQPAPTPTPAQTAAATKPAGAAAAPQPAAIAKPKPSVQQAGVEAVAEPAAKPGPTQKASEPNKAVEVGAEATQAVGASSGGSLKDYGVIEQTSIVGGISRTSAVWAQGFLGYDRHKNVAPGNQENPTRTAVTGGGLVGADWTHVNRADRVEAIQFGIFSGYSATRAKLTDTFFAVNEADGPPDTLPGGGNTNYFRQDNKETIDGPFIGAYLAYAQDTWSMDVAFKADFFDLTQSSRLRQRCDDDVGVQNGSASVNNYMIATNVAHRNDINDHQWWAPTVGLRYTFTDFGKDPSTSVFRDGGVQPTGRLGLEDGSALRLQFGVRLGDRVETANGYIWTTTVGAFLYSDVLISGFETVAGQTGEAVGPVDEGKIRALGQLETRLDVGNGVSYLLQAELRGGGDVFGAAGQVGIRYEW
jgi:hypothetical protein